MCDVACGIMSHVMLLLHWSVIHCHSGSGLVTSIVKVVYTYLKIGM